MNEEPRAGSGAVAFSLVCSLLAAAPAVVRVQAHPFPSAVVLLVAATSLIVVPLGVWIRGARARGWSRTERALLAGLALCAAPLAFFGGVLKSTTHHRPLGGATFAVAGLCVLALCVALSFRVLGEPRRLPGKFSWPNLFILGCGLSVGAVMVLGVARAARPSLVDFCAVALSVIFAGLVPLPHKLTRSAPWSTAGKVAWGVLLVCAVVLLKDSQLVGSLATQAPVSFAPLSWLGGGS